MTIHDLIQSGDLDGYREVLATDAVREIDQEIAEAATCPACGGPCGYRGFKRPGSYLAYHVCRRCGTATEF